MARSYPATIAAPVSGELEIKRSRFLTHVHPVSSVADADAVIADVRKRYWDARHNCVAMVTGLLGDQTRSSDDGEPSGTAGVPMLEVLRRRDLTDLVVIVTRYFGGVKLGAGGLIRAYSTAVSETLDAARLLHREALVRATVTVPHAEAGRVDHALRAWSGAHGATLGETTYAAAATLEVWVPDETRGDLQATVEAVTSGAASPEFGETRVVDVPV
ncbi:IMPACT family protein [Microbacterium gorillae]|uniref:IMPACT family protein n=1 Tax=Microbacterium gorillae TaxID=1231063 RepID=UPI00058BB601|nr:YigZ family protein [Microbacterium gorillae]